MTLSGMLNLSKDALICDLAETYHIYDMRSLPLRTVATLAAGLREDSRIVMLAGGLEARQDSLLLAMIADRVELLRYGLAGEKSLPTSLTETMLGKTKKKGVRSFRTAQEFEAALAKFNGE